MKTYTINGQTYDHIPNPLTIGDITYSPVTEALFLELGGTIHDDGQPTPKEKFFSDLNAYMSDLEAEAERLALDITVDEFKQAAATKMSTDLIAWAKSKGVPDEMIEVVRGQILAFIADASRLGLTWNDIFPKQPSN